MSSRAVGVDALRAIAVLAAMVWLILAALAASMPRLPLEAWMARRPAA